MQKPELKKGLDTWNCDFICQIKTAITKGQQKQLKDKYREAEIKRC